MPVECNDAIDVHAHLSVNVIQENSRNEDAREG